VFFVNQVQNLTPTIATVLPDGTRVRSQKDPAYMAAQFIYALWLLFMALKAVVGFRANLKVKKKSQDSPPSSLTKIGREKKQ